MDMANRMDTWTTSISSISSDDIRIRGVSLGELIGSASFAEVAYLALTGNRGSEGHHRVLDAILVAIVDHGISPSVTVARMMASYGSPIQAGLAAGVLTVGDNHAGACQQLAHEMRAAVAPGASEEEIEAAANRLVEGARNDGRRIHGFGHPQHGEDPRARWLNAVAIEEGVFGTYSTLAAGIEQAISVRSGRKVPINIDGICAALILDLGVPPEASRGVIAISRMVGLTAHYVEEQLSGTRWRHVPEEWVTYE